jgi:hypothetical protein
MNMLVGLEWGSTQGFLCTSALLLSRHRGSEPLEGRVNVT